METLTPTPRKLIRTLAVDPGTRRLGIAALEEEEITLCRVYKIKKRKTRTAMRLEAERFVQNLIETLDPDVFVIEKTRYAASHRSPLLHPFVNTLTRYAKRRGLTVLSPTRPEVKETLTGNRRIRKEKLAEFLVHEWYPDQRGLLKRLRTNLLNKDGYWQSMFDALALALVGFQEMSRKTYPDDSKHPKT